MKQTIIIISALFLISFVPVNRKIPFSWKLFRFLDNPRLVFAQSIPKGNKTNPLNLLNSRHNIAMKKERAKIKAIETRLEDIALQLKNLKKGKSISMSEDEGPLSAILRLVHEKERLQNELDSLQQKMKQKQTKFIKETRRVKVEIKAEIKAELIKSMELDIKKYKEILASKYGEDLRESAWKVLLSKYPLKKTKGLKSGDIDSLQFKVVYNGIINSIGMKFVLIDPGAFSMGSSTREKGRGEDEKKHSVTINKPFYIQTTEITQAQWKSIRRKNPSFFLNKGDDYPVEKISWTDCKVFIRKLNKLEPSKKYRLPTEAEWEYACRAGKKSAFTNGGIKTLDCKKDSKLSDIGWYCFNSENSTHPVGSKGHNAWGIYDMHGNVSEWCSDVYDKYPGKPVNDPQGQETRTLTYHPRRKLGKLRQKLPFCFSP